MIISLQAPTIPTEPGMWRASGRANRIQSNIASMAQSLAAFNNSFLFFRWGETGTMLDRIDLFVLLDLIGTKETKFVALKKESVVRVAIILSDPTFYQINSIY